MIHTKKSLLKQLTRIAGALEKIEKKLPDIIVTPNEYRATFGQNPLKDFTVDSRKHKVEEL